MYKLFIVAALVIFQVSLSEAENPLSRITHMLRRHEDNSYAEAYVTMLPPTKVSFDHKALLRGLNAAKNCIGRLSTVDPNEYAYIDNPMQLGVTLAFVAPPTLKGSRQSSTPKH